MPDGVSAAFATALEKLGLRVHRIPLEELFGKAFGLQGVDLLDPAPLKARDGAFGAGYGHDAVDVDDPVANLRVRWAVSGRWKLLLPFRRNLPNGSLELYDVVADPGETQNRAREKPVVVEIMVKRIQDWWPLEDTLPPRIQTPPPETIRSSRPAARTS